MANLRGDLLNELRNQKYYAEIELVRLAQDGTLNYKTKIDNINSVLSEIALINQKMALADAYFTAPEQEETRTPAPAPVPEPQAAPVPTTVHAGQSHGE